jgi:glycosyltransferase involved in cell wall biosynthesis
MRLLVITQVVDKNHANLGFFHEWLRRLSLEVEQLTVICLQKGQCDLPLNVRVFPLGKDERASRLAYLWRFFRVITRERKNYDGVFVHMNQIYIVLAGLFWKLWKKPVLLWYVHRSVSPTLLVAERWASGIFTTSPESFRLKSVKVHYVGHGIDTILFNNTSTPTLQPLRLVTAGRIAPAKDLETIIKGFAQVVKSAPNRNATLTIVGEVGKAADKKYSEELRALVSHLGLTDKVVFTGPITQQELPYVLSSHSIFIHASKTGSVDKAVLEALALGLEVATSSEGFHSLGQKGIVTNFEAQNSARLADAIIKIVERNDCSYNARGREYVVQNHDLNTLVKHIIDFFSKYSKPEKKNYKKWWTVCIVALLVRLLVLFGTYQASGYNYENFLNHIKMDGYYEIAVNVIEHKSFSRNGQILLQPDSLRTPGYPGFIVPFLFIFHSVWPLVLFQIMIGSTLPLLGKKLALQFHFSDVTTTIIVWLLVFEPMGILLSTKILTETLFTFFLLAAISTAISFIVRVRENYPNIQLFIPVMLSAVCFAFSALIRPTTLYIPPLFVILWLLIRFLKRQDVRLRVIVIGVLVWAACITPWMVRNRIVFGVLGFSSIQQQVLFSYLVPSIFSVELHQSFGVAQAAWFKANGFDLYPEIFLDKAAWFQGKALTVIGNHIPGFIKVSGVSIFTFLTHDGLLDLWSSVGWGDSVLTAAQVRNVSFGSFLLGVMLLMRIVWGSLSLLVFVGFALKLSRRQVSGEWWVVYLLIVYFALTTVSNGLGVNARFRTPINALIFIAALDGVGMLHSSKKRLEKSV